MKYSIGDKVIVKESGIDRFGQWLKSEEGDTND